MALNAEQQRNARAIIDVGLTMHMPPDAIAAALATALMESGLRNLNYGDRDSLGLFQQRANWGSAEERTNPSVAASKFFKAYSKASGSTVLERIANTQRPAAQYRDNYANFFGQAQQVFSDITGQPAPNMTGKPTGTPAVSGEPTVTAASASSVDELPPDATPAQITAYIEKHYPQAAPFLANEEIRNLLVRPDIDEMDSLEIEALLRKTNYWQTHGPESRAFDALIGTDGGAAGALVDKTKRLLGDLFDQNGLPYDDDFLGKAAKQSIRAGWVNLQGQVTDSGSLKDFVVYFHRLSGNDKTDAELKGDPGALAAKLGSLAKAYYVPMTQHDLNDWALKVVSGQATEDSFGQYIRQLAKGRFIGDKDVISAIDAGLTTDQYFAPIRNIIAQTLELNPQDVDMSSPRFMAISQFYDDKTGTRRSPTLGEAAQWARSQPDYAKTESYKQQNADFTLKMAKSFGAIA